MNDYLVERVIWPAWVSWRQAQLPSSLQRLFSVIPNLHINKRFARGSTARLIHEIVSYIFVVNVRQVAIAYHFFGAWAAQHLVPFSMLRLQQNEAVRLLHMHHTATADADKLA